MTDSKRGLKDWISLRLVVIIMFVVGATVSALLLYTMMRVTDQYQEMENATLDYIEAQNQAYAMRDAISDLNERSRNFIVTGNLEEVILYFNEVQVQRSRDLAMEDIRSRLDDEQIMKHLNTAFSLSDRMMTTQYYAMRLAVDAYGYELEKIPVALGEVELSQEDLALTAEEQLARAREMLFSKEYTLLKGQVDIRIELCKDALIETMRSRHLDSSDRLQELLKTQRRLVLALMISLLLMLVFVLTLVVYPISRLITGIQEERFISLRGSSEIRFLAGTYNQMFEKMEDTNAKLSYEAAHDALTGLYNRGYYEAIRNQSASRSIALLIVDVDLFKEVNDTWGHDIGDQVLIRVARVLSDSFRDADRVCRIGGDEFSVIMMDVSSSMEEVIRKKIAAAAEILREPEGDVPPVTMSVGVAFSDGVKEGDTLFKNADRALYRIKQGGRNGCGFFSEELDRRGEEMRS